MPAHGNEAKLRDLRLGMHRYRFGVHHQSRPRIRLDKAPVFPKGKGYRALRPINAGAFYDDNRDRTQNPKEPLSHTDQHNIHAGNASDQESGFTGSEGCQVVKEWGQFKKFIEVVESDYSLNETDKNEMADPAPAGNVPVRDITYTLLDSTCLFPCMLPVGKDKKKLVISFTDTATALANVKSLLEDVNRGFHGGNFPIGQNNCWHGGLHVAADLNTPIYAPMAGEIVAFRLGNGGAGQASARWQQNGEERSLDLGNRNFILMRHRMEDAMGCLLTGQAYSDSKGNVLGGHEKVFYSLYMHLAEHRDLTQKNIGEDAFPFRWMQDGYTVKKTEDKKHPTSFPAYPTLLDGDGVVRSKRAMVDTHHGKVTLVPGDRFRVLQDNLLVQDNDVWVQIERYFDGAASSYLDRPQKLYTLKKHVGRKFSALFPEWKQRDFLPALTRGDILIAEEAFGHPVLVNPGDLLWRTGAGVQPGGNTGGFLHWSVFSTEPIFPGWNQIVDDTQDSIIEDRKVLDLVPQAPERKGKPLLWWEVRDFYRSEEPEVKQKVWKLGWTAVKFQTEWAGDPAQHATHLGTMPLEEGKKLNQEHYKSAAAPFLWWGDVAAKVGLPTDGKVWHYNPAIFTLALGVFTESAAERFSDYACERLSLDRSPGIRWQEYATLKPLEDVGLAPWEKLAGF
ncbi:hypothetical protein [Holophaga foetida]|uniref:hypothetical protein n=1 Tax=Holophaga foetida TaxID=35839 RepID=UPI0011DE1429|nr:hypothetical protein [Holophaga foetida]